MPWGSNRLTSKPGELSKVICPSPWATPRVRGAGSTVEVMTADFVDAKDIAPEALAQVLSRHGVSDRAVVYQDVAYLEKLKSVAPALRRMPPLRNAAQLDAIAERVRPYAVDARWTILSKPLIDRCHALGIKVFSDAIGANESVERYQKAVRDGLDLIQTDHPVRVLRALELFERPAPVNP